MKLIVFKLIALIVFFSFCSLLEGAEVEFGIANIPSLNGKYTLMVTGWYHDSLEGECTFSLYDATSTLLWEKTLNYGGSPAVSNTGETAIPQYDNKIWFYNTAGDVIGKFPQTYDGQFLSDALGFPWIPSQYSRTGERYFVFTGESDSYSALLWCLDHVGNPLWHIHLGHYYSCHIYTLQNRVLIDDFCTASLEYENSVFVLDSHDGAIIQQYPINVTRSAQILPISDKEFILVHDGKEKEYARYNPATGEQMAALSLNDMLVRLSSTNSQEVLFVLQMLLSYDRTQQLPQKVITELQHVKRREAFSFSDNEDMCSLKNQVLAKWSIADTRQTCQPYTGRVVDYYPNGERKSEVQYHNGKKHGVQTIWYENGMKWSEAHYIEDIIEGTMTIWSRTGEIREQIKY